MKCQNLFSGKSNKKCFKCCLQQCLPSVLSIKISGGLTRMILSLQPVTESLPLLDLQIIHQIQYHIYPKYVDRQA